MPAAIPVSVECLQNAVSLHLTAIEHYATAAEHLSRIGYGKLATRFAEDAEEEHNHLKAAVARLEFFQTAPVLTHSPPAWPRYDVPGILQASLQLEQMAAEAERAHIVEVRGVADEGTAEVFAELLKGSEESILKLEADQLTLSQVGADNWLADQLG